MKVNELKQALVLCRAAKVTPFIWGHRGLGKSSIVRQVCETMHIGIIDMRLGQLEGSDIRGIPDKSDGRTVFLPPDEFPRGGLSWEEYEQQLAAAPAHERGTLALRLQPRLNEGILFLDEPNRAQDDVLQAVFQLVLDRRVGQCALPDGWSVVCAGNFMEGDYIVSGFNDSAFLDRFCHLTLSGGEHTLDDWVDYMSERHGEDASSVLQFVSQNVKHLDGEVAGQLGFEIQPSRRSWDTVVNVTKAARKQHFDSKVTQDVIAGLVGLELAHSYMNYNCPLQPRDIIDKGVKHHEQTLKELTRGQLIGLTWGLVSFIKPRIEEDAVADVACDYALWLCHHSDDKDVVVAFCRSLLIEGKSSELDKARVAALSNKNVAALFARITEGQPKRKSFIFRLNERPELAELLNRTIWGKVPQE